MHWTLERHCTWNVHCTWNRHCTLEGFLLCNNFIFFQCTVSPLLKYFHLCAIVLGHTFHRWLTRWGSTSAIVIYLSSRWSCQIRIYCCLLLLNLRNWCFLKMAGHFWQRWPCRRIIFNIGKWRTWVSCIWNIRVYRRIIQPKRAICQSVFWFFWNFMGIKIGIVKWLSHFWKDFAEKIF